MRHRLSIPTVILFAALTASPPNAWPCSLVPGVDGPSISGRVGPSPLLVSTQSDATLTSSAGREIAIQSVPPPTELVGALGAQGQTLTYFRPSAPLADGEYRLGNTQFTSSSSVTDVVPALGTRATLALYPGDEGSDGFCGDTSALILDLQDMPITSFENALFLVRFERSNGASFSRLVNQSERYEGSVRVRFYHAFPETGALSEEKLCVRVAGVSATGVVGASLDLGCVDPASATDPRVFRSEGAGCSTSSRGTGASVVWLLAGFLLLGLVRRRI